MDRIVDRPGALDVHKASVTACVCVWEGSKLEEHVAEFQITVQGLLALPDRLDALDVKHVAMEATGVYWRPLWATLEDRFELMLVNRDRSNRSSGGTRISRTPSGSASHSRPGCSRRTSCRPSRSARSQT